VVVVLGHVDHGKTTLLDYLRKSNISGKEIGGITQKIGAYEIFVKIKGYKINKITFIDTPGHEVFTRLRLRGAKVADIAVLLIDAIDSVMPQTVESIYHIKNAKIPFIIAVNKIDLPQANLDRVKKDLLKHDILVEGMGGDISFVPISAKTGKGINNLLEMILFVSSVEDLKYSVKNPVRAYIIESKRNKSGVIASVVIKDGKLQIGEIVYALDKKAKIKAIVNDRGRSLKEVYPSTPFLLLGFKEPPEVGAILTKEKKELAEPPLIVEKRLPKDSQDLFKEEEKRKLKLIIKTDTFGSLETILSHLSDNKNIEIILASIGEINKSDLFLAKISKAIIIGFSLSVNKKIIDLAKEEKIVIKTYSLIYKLLEELVEVSDLLKEKEKKELRLKGEAKILASFIIEKERIAGVKIIKGKINLEDQIDLYRNNKLMGKGKVVSLKIKAKTVSQIKKNEEGGMIFYPQLDFNIGDVVKSYSI
jgi:translation initiation factor IF-2